MILDDWLDDRKIAGRPSDSERKRALALDIAELLPLFAWMHLPPQLASASQPFGELASAVVDQAPEPSLQLVDALTHLLKAKDSAVRARLVKPK